MDALQRNFLKCLHLSASVIVVKVGSSAIIENKMLWPTLSREIAYLKKAGKQVAVVFSGAVAEGSIDYAGKLNRAAMSCIGHVKVIPELASELLTAEIETALLLTPSNTFEEPGYAHRLKELLESFFKNNIVPIINENDAFKGVMDGEMSCNDYLASRVAELINANLVIYLSNVDGVFSDMETAVARESAPIPMLSHSNADSFSLSGCKSATGTGGIQAKINSCLYNLCHGCESLIINGLYPYPISHAISTGKYTAIKEE